MTWCWLVSDDAGGERMVSHLDQEKVQTSEGCATPLWNQKPPSVRLTSLIWRFPFPTSDLCCCFLLRSSGSQSVTGFCSVCFRSVTTRVRLGWWSSWWRRWPPSLSSTLTVWWGNSVIRGSASPTCSPKTPASGPCRWQVHPGGRSQNVAPPSSTWNDDALHKASRAHSCRNRCNKFVRRKNRK